MRVPTDKELDAAAAALATAYLNRVFQLRGTRDEWARKSLMNEASVYADAFRGLTGVWPSTNVNKIKAMHPQHVPIIEAMAQILCALDNGDQPSKAQIAAARMAMHSAGIDWREAS